MKQFTTTNYSLSKKSLEQIPFHIAEELFISAYNQVMEEGERQNREKYDAYLEKLEQEYNDTHEGSFEGNFSDSVPYQQDASIPPKARKAGFDAIISDFLPKYKMLKEGTTWILPQIMAYLTRKPLDLETVSTLEGKISGTKMLAHIFDLSNEWDLGLYRVLMLNSRAGYLTTQYKAPAKQYCGLVPLIPYAFKLLKGVKYSQWDRATLHKVVNKDLADAMLCTVPEDLTREEILEARDQGLIYKTGKNAGEMRNPVTTFKLYDTTDTKIHKLPELAKTMLAQIWCAHPENRTKYMILDPMNWDNIPAPLIAHDIFKAPATPYTPTEYVPGQKPPATPTSAWDL